MKYKYIIFDCDGVLVDSEFLACTTLSEMLLPYGGIISAEKIMSDYVGMKDVEVVKILSSLLQLILPHEFMYQYEKTLDIKLENNLEAIPGIDFILKNLRLPNALVSNSNYPRIIISLKSAGLLSYFKKENIFSPDLAMVSKPDPGIYLYALKQLGINADEAIVIEDSPTGVSAASGAGIEVIGFLAASHSENQEEALLKNGAIDIAHNCLELQEILKNKDIL